MILIILIGFMFGVAIGIPVTEWLYIGGGWPRNYWNKRISHRFIRANIPVGFVLFGITALLVSSPESRLFCISIALGMGVSAVGRAFYGFQPK